MLWWLGLPLMMAAFVAAALVRAGLAPAPTRLAPAPTRLAPAPTRPDVVVGSNVQVSKPHADVPHVATVLAADPQDPQRLLAGAILIDPLSGRRDVVVYVSADGGRTWEASLNHQNAVDPALAIGPNGAVYFICTDYPLDPRPLESLGLYFFRSGDGGSHWEQGLPLRFPSYSGLDRPWITTDHTGGRFSGRVYASFHASATPLLGTSEGGDMQVLPLLASADGGRTFAPSTAGNTRVSHGPGGVIGGPGGVLSDGTYVAPYIAAIEPTVTMHWKICVARSTDGGASFGIFSTGAPDMSAVGVLRYPETEALLANRQSIGNRLPILACDPGSTRFKDRLYLVWNDYKEDKGMRVMLSSSQDKGRSWTRPDFISDIPAQLRASKRGYAGTPGVAVNKDGVVGVTWYDTRHLPAGAAGGWDMHFTASADGGATWSPSVRVSETSSLLENPQTDPHVTVPMDVGDSGGLAADANGVFHALWLDNRTGTRQLWTATVTVKPEQKN